jgi:hypothetical protein
VTTSMDGVEDDDSLFKLRRLGEGVDARGLTGRPDASEANGAKQGMLML